MSNFDQLGLSEALVNSVKNVGYEAPSPIQAEGIPVLMRGNDLIAQAQTGTGKTATFALPIIDRVQQQHAYPQALILAPTRELAIQVAEAFKRYATHLKKLAILPLYGGQDYRSQLKALKRGSHIIVGTPGRVMDHIRRGSLVLDQLSHVVLDEADEMLNMGFIEDIEWILNQIESSYQMALFSATMPSLIKRVAKKYTNNPTLINLSPKVKTVSSVEQAYTLVNRKNKLEAITRFLEIEPFDAAIVFTRTKASSVELSDKLEARGYSAAALNGDMNQIAREKTIKRLRQGKLDIIVATDVAARGIDVERIDLVINYDMPTDPESYVHRIGRTGRAGRTGKALLFATPRETNMLRLIEKTINQQIPLIAPPTNRELNVKQANQFNASVLQVIDSKTLDSQRNLLSELVKQNEVSENDVAAALIYLLQKDQQRYSDDNTSLLAKPEKQQHKPGKKPGKRFGSKRPANKKFSGKFSKKDSAKKGNGRKEKKPFSKTRKAKPVKKKR